MSSVEIRTIERRNFSVKETAAIINVSTDVVYELIRTKNLRCMKIPLIKVPDFEIDRFLRQTLEEGIDYTDILKKEKAS